MSFLQSKVQRLQKLRQISNLNPYKQPIKVKKPHRLNPIKKVESEEQAKEIAE